MQAKTRKLNVRASAKPATVAPALITKPASPVAPVIALPAKPVATAKPATPAKADAKPAAAPAGPPRHVARTITTIDRQATHYATGSDRDNAYLAFYASLAKRNGGKFTVADIAACGRKPVYNGSNKPHDAGVIVRLTKAGYIAGSSGDHAFTERGKTLAVYASAPVASA